MKQVVFPQNIVFQGRSHDMMSFSDDNELKKAVNFLLEVDCNFTRVGDHITLFNAELCGARWEDSKQGIDLEILTIYSLKVRYIRV